jgi:hypothetical protein
MQRAFVTAAVVMAAFLSFALAASGATSAKQAVVLPKKGGVYVGTIKSTFDLAVTLSVSPNGKSLRIRWSCGTGRGSTAAKNVAIDSTGSFRASGNLWNVEGRFVSATQARVSINDIPCGGSKGSTRLTLK